jgi:hypothetical protein
MNGDAPAEKVGKEEPMRVAQFADAHRLQDARVLHLLDDFASFELADEAVVVGLDAADKVRRAGDHFVEQVHQRVAERSSHRLLSARLRGQALGRSGSRLFGGQISRREIGNWKCNLTGTAHSRSWSSGRRCGGPS